MNLTQEDLAARADVSVRSVAGWESGETEPTTRMVMKLAEALSVPAEWLLGAGIETIPASVVEKAKEAETVYEGRTGRLLRRIAELTDHEWIRIEPAILGILDAILALRDPDSKKLTPDFLKAQIDAVRKAAGIPGRDLKSDSGTIGETTHDESEQATQSEHRSSRRSRP